MKIIYIISYMRYIIYTEVYTPLLNFCTVNSCIYINFLSHSASLAQNTLLMMSHSVIHLPPAHHSHPPSHIHCFIPGSKLTFSSNLFHQSAGTHLDCLLGLYCTGLTLLNGFSFLVNFFFLFWVVRYVADF